jgi:hypothetical protein
MKNSNRLFKEEEDTLARFKKLTDQMAHGDVKVEMLLMTQKFHDLLHQAEFLTRVSDRLEKKLEKVNNEMTQRNYRLEKTLEALRRARVSKRAFVIVYFIVIALFILEEFFITPLTGFIGFAGNVFWAGVMIKLAIAIALKPAESFLEKKFLDKHKSR